jgi:hypothetical protein
MQGAPMTRLPLLLLLCGALVAAAGCNQTAAPAAPATTVRAKTGALGSGARDAMADVEATREQHKSRSAALGVITFIDPTGLSEFAAAAAEREHERVMDEKLRRVREEVERTVAEAEAEKARTRPARQRARSNASARQAAP